METHHISLAATEKLDNFSHNPVAPPLRARRLPTTQYHPMTMRDEPNPSSPNSQNPPVGPGIGTKRRRRSTNTSLKVGLPHSSLSRNALLDSRRVSLNPNQRIRNRAMEKWMVRRWDSIRLKRPVLNPKISRTEENTTRIMKGDEVTISA